MAQKPLHLVERAAARMLQDGALDATGAQLLGNDRRAAAELAGVAAPAAAPPAAAPAMDLPRTAPAGATNGVATPIAAASAPDAAQITSFQPVSLQPASAQSALAGAFRARPATVVIDMTTLQRAGMIDWSNVRSRVSEEFRLAQRQILRAAFSTPGAEAGHGNLLMVTSARPGEGKSFSALNLGASIARQGDHRVLLIDIDSKDASVGRALGLSGSIGLLDLATDPSLDPGQFIVRTAIPNLSVLPLGTDLERSAESFASQPMMRLIQTIARRYADRLVILDAAPCLSTSDPAALAPVVGQILFVVEAERTQREEIEASLDHIQACPTIMLMLNKVRLSTQHSFGAYASAYTS